MNKIHALCLSSSLLLPLAAVADHQRGPVYRSYESGLYLNGGIGASSFDWEARDVRYSFGDGSLSGIEVDNESASFRLGLGYEFGSSLALEMGYVAVGDLSASAISNGSLFNQNGYDSGPVDIDGDVAGVYFGVNLHTPYDEPFGLFVRGGMFSWAFDGRVEDSARSGHFTVEGVDPYVGGGLRFEVAPGTSLLLSYDYYVFDDDESFKSSADTVTAELLLRF